MSISALSNIGQIVADNYRFASVFKSAGIDFCCNGNRTIAEACEKKKMNVDELLQKLHDAGTSTSQGNDIDFKTWPLDLMIDYIIKKHHRYVEKKIVEITPYLKRVITVHGEHHPELLEIGELFFQSAEDLTSHMQKEEGMLFPFIKNMVNAEENGESLAQAGFGSVENPIAMMHHEHDAEGERFRLISELSDGYTPPEDACNTYRVTFALLEEFEDDLHRHIHLENNILFPRAIQLEKQIRN
jgi:regulator of cell morphogenesis and NO signaling